MQIEISVGDRFKLFGKQYVAVECKSLFQKCMRCALKGNGTPCCFLACISASRSDDKDIIFMNVLK